MSTGLRGSVGDFPLRTILRLFADTKKTGELQIRQGDRVGALGLADGRVVCAVYGEEPPIVALGEIFTLDGAEFEFTGWDEAPPANLEGELDDLLRKAEDHRKWISSVREVIPDDRVRFRLSERAAQQGAVTFTSERWRVVLAVNGDRDVMALAETLHIDRDAALTTLAGLVRDGVIDAVLPTEATAPPKQPAAPVELAVMAPEPVVTAPEPVKEPEPPPPPPPSFETTPQWGAPADMAPAPPVRVPEPVFEPTPPPLPPAMADWGPSEPIAAAPEPIAPAPKPPPAPQADTSTEDRLAALSGIFGPAPTAEPPPPLPLPAADHWSAPATTPTSDPWAAPAPPPASDQWSAPPASSALNEWSAPSGTDQWSAPAPAAPAADQWTAPAAAPASEWATPAADDPRLAAFALPAAPAATETPPAPKHAARAAVDEWAAPPADAAPAAPEKKRGLFGFGRKEKAQAAAPSVVAVGPVSRPAMLAALSNAMIGEYNSGRYGKNAVETRMASLLMRVDEQADPIDKPLPIVDERIDVQALDRDRTPSDQIAPYLAVLVGTIYAEAEKLFGKDKAKKGYKAAMVSALGSDSVALATPELAGKLPKV